jgi:hypothetical protein
VNEPEFVRSYALKIWNAAAGNLEDLRSILITDPLYVSAIWFRMLLGDRSTTSDLVSLLPTKPWWLAQIPKIWSDELESVVAMHLERHVANPPANVWSNEDFRLGQVLRDIPSPIAEGLLVQYWDKLKTRPIFIQLALYISTEKTRALARAALENADEEVFKFIGMFFGMNWSRLVDRLSLNKLESLRPYLGSLDDMTVSEIIDFCGKSGWLKWAKAHLLPEYERRKNEEAPEGNKQKGIIERSVLRWMPSKNQIFRELDEIGSEEFPANFRLQFLSETFLERGDSLEAFCEITQEWFAIAPSNLRLRLAATVIQHWGKRSHLPFLLSAYQAQETVAISPTFQDVKFTVERRSLS